MLTTTPPHSAGLLSVSEEWTQVEGRLDLNLIRDEAHARIDARRRQVEQAQTPVCSSAEQAVTETRRLLRAVFPPARAIPVAGSSANPLPRSPGGELVLLGGTLSDARMCGVLLAALTECNDGRPIDLMLNAPDDRVQAMSEAAGNINMRRYLNAEADVSGLLEGFNESDHQLIELLSAAKRCHAKVRAFGAAASPQEAIRRVSEACSAGAGPVIVLGPTEHIAGLRASLDPGQRAATVLQVDSTAGPAANAAVALANVAAFRADAAPPASPSDVRTLARQLGVPQAPLGPTIGRLAKACHVRYHDWLSWHRDASEAERNAAGARIVHWGCCARHLGLTANMWRFSDPVDPHIFCVVGKVPSLTDPHQPAGRLDKQGQWKADGLWAVDGWARVCCRTSQFTGAFRRKMELWARKGKEIWVAIDRRGGTEWLSPLDKRWARATYEGEAQKETSVRARPE